MDRTELPLKPVPVQPLRDDDFGRRLVGWLIPAYVVMIFAGAITFRMHASMMRGNEMSVDRAVLAAVNAGTLTGFQTAAVNPNDYQPLGQVNMLALTVGGSLLTFIIGGLAVVRILRLPYRDSRVISAALIAVVAAGFIGATGLFGDGRSTFAGISQGVSALGNSGVFVGKPYGVLEWQTYLILLPLIVLGGLGLTVLMELFDGVAHHRPISPHSRTVLLWAAGIYLLFFLLLSVLRLLSTDWSRVDPGTFSTILGSSSVQAINSRTAGLPIEFAYTFPRTVQWVLIVGMAVGGSSGGTAGGIKMTTLAEVFRGVGRALRGAPVGRPFGIAMTWIGAYAGLALLAVLALLASEAQLPGDRALFLAVSALSNVGMSHDMLSISVPGEYILCAVMLVGRMTPLLILWWMADTTAGAELAVG